MNPEDVSPIFFGIWVVLGSISFLIFFVSKNAERKKKLWAPFVIFAGVLFIGFTYVMGLDGQHLYVMVPMVILISFLNIRLTKFCGACGKTNINQNFFSPAKFCNKCGNALE